MVLPHGELGDLRDPIRDAKCCGMKEYQNLLKGLSRIRLLVQVELATQVCEFVEL